MRRDALLEILADRGVLLSPDALEYVEKEVDAEDDVRAVIEGIDSPEILGIDRVRALSSAL